MNGWISRLSVGLSIVIAGCYVKVDSQIPNPESSMSLQEQAVALRIESLRATPNTISPREISNLRVVASDYGFSPIKYIWEAHDGTILANRGQMVTWVPPDNIKEKTVYEIKVIAVSLNGKDEATVRIVVDPYIDLDKNEKK